MTLKLDKAVIEKAKQYASLHHKSLSRMIESYLKSLVDEDHPETNNTIEISPFVKSIKSGVKIPEDINYKNAYGKYLKEKYQ